MRAVDVCTASTSNTVYRFQDLEANLSSQFWLAPGKHCQDDPLRCKKKRKLAPEPGLQGFQLETVCAGNSVVEKPMKASSSKILTHIYHGI